MPSSTTGFTETLAGLAKRLPRPKAVCVVSAHWVTRGSEVLAVAKPRTIHDFYGFPAPLYEVEYPAPGAPTEAERVATRTGNQTGRNVGIRSRRVERPAAPLS